MDSNFQVKISVDLSQLNSRLKEVDSALKSLGFTADESNKKMTKSFEQTAVAAQRVSADMSRVRLATFAFGQVIRDAGFFSQNFGLGMLAISNNIPILIDQLVLLSGVSAGLGSVLSVLGSVLAAGLTVFAYWAQGVERNGETVSGAINKMANDSESSIGRLVNYLNTPPASEILGKAITGIQEGMEAISKIIDAGVTLAIALWERFGPAVMIALNSFFSMAKNVMLISLNLLRLGAAIVQGDWSKALKAIGNIGKLVFNNLIEFAQAYISLVTKGLGAVIKLYDPLKGTMLQVAGEQFVKLGDSFKFATEDLGGFNFDLIALINNLFKADKQAKTTAKSIEDLDKGRREPALPKSAYVKEPFDKPIYEALKGKPVKQVDLVKSKIPAGGLEAEQLKEMVLNLIELEKQIDDVLVNGIANTIGEAMMAIGEAFATGGDIGKAFGNALLSSLASVLSRFGDMLIAASLAGLQFSTAFKNLFDTKNWGLALAAGIALKMTAGALSGFTRNPTGGGGGANVASAASGMGGGLDNRGMGPIYTRSTISNIGLSSQANPVLETRVSGNDLVILMKRADKNRNGYY
jgi:hypothetical protein